MFSEEVKQLSASDANNLPAKGQYCYSNFFGGLVDTHGSTRCSLHITIANLERHIRELVGAASVLNSFVNTGQ